MEGLSLFLTVFLALVIPIVMARLRVTTVPTAVAEIIVGILMGKMSEPDYPDFPADFFVQPGGHRLDVFVRDGDQLQPVQKAAWGTQRQKVAG